MYTSGCLRGRMIQRRECFQEIPQRGAYPTCRRVEIFSVYVPASAGQSALKIRHPERQTISFHPAVGEAAGMDTDLERNAAQRV